MTKKSDKHTTKTSTAKLSELLETPDKRHKGAAVDLEKVEQEVDAADKTMHAVEVDLDELHAELAELKDKLVRARAEIDNIQRRAERDIAKAHRRSGEQILQDLLPVVDALEGALQDQSRAVTTHEGVQLTLDMLLKVMEKFGVTVVDPVDQPFNPELHEAISMQQQAKATSNTVLQVSQKGYLLNERLLRPALVVVAK